MTAPPDLVAPVEETKPWEGAGLASGLADTKESLEKGDALAIAADAGSVGIDALGFVMDPFGSVASAGVGWLIEHVWFLREPLDALAGDPNRIKAQARTWASVGTELRAVVAEDRTAGAGLQAGWQGDAAASYLHSAGVWQAGVESAAGGTDVLADSVLKWGALLGTLRSAIRDQIADWLGEVVRWAAAAMVTAPLTLGGSLAALGVAVGLEAVELARKFIAILRKLQEQLTTAADVLGRVADSLGEAVEKVVGRAAGHGITADGLDSWVKDPLGVPTVVADAERRFADGHVTDVLTGVKNVHEAQAGPAEEARTGG